MSKSENGAIVGQVIKAVVGLLGTVAVGIFSAKKGRDKYKDWKGQKKQ